MSVSKSSQCLYLLRVGSECLFAYHGPLSCTWKWLGRVGDQDHLFEYLCEPRRGRIGVFYDRPVGLLIELFRLETGTWDIPYLVSVTGKSVMVCRVNSMPVAGLDEHTGLLALTAEHDTARDECVGRDERLLRNWNDFLS